jgi:hypothetical protein
MSENNPTPKKGLDSNIVAAIIATAGTVLVTLITIYFRGPGSQAPQPTTAPMVITATALSTNTPGSVQPTEEPTEVSVPTDTPLPAATETNTAIPLFAAGEDWIQGCISTVWTIFPNSLDAPSENGCYVEPLMGVFTARNQQLEVSVEKNATEVDGVFTEIPNDSIVDLILHLNEISTGELWIGIFAEPNVHSPGFLVVVPEGNPKNSAFAVHEMPADERIYLSSKFSKPDAEYRITFDVTPSDVLAKFEVYSSTPKIRVSSSEKYLFIGYETTLGKTNFVIADLLNLIITPR